jgi:hypothetical protein
MRQCVKWLLYLAVLVASFQSVQAQNYDEQVQEMYVAYYGRPGDPGGIDFWSGQLSANNGDLSAIIDSFGNSQEYIDEFGALTNSELINNIYQQLFGRDADAAGLDFYESSLAAGERTLASIALDVSNGVQDGTDDAAIVANKLEVAAFFTDAVSELSVNYGSDQIESARELIAAVGASEESLNAAVDATLPLVAAYPDADSDAFSYFVDEVSDDVLQEICIACHVSGGAASNSRLVYVPSSSPDYHSLNFSQWQALADAENDIVDYALNKAQGLGHGGGTQAAVGSDAYNALQQFLLLLSGESGSQSNAEFFQGFSIANSEETYRRAAMLVAGELPSAASLSAAASADENELRVMLRELMEGDEFHKFLIEGANDRLLTDKWIEDRPVTLFFQPFYPDLANLAAELGDANIDDAYTEDVIKLLEGISWGIAREPLELIARVVEEELPYTEILTADYTMVNPQLAQAYRANVEFSTDEDIDQWKVATTEGYTRIDESTVYEDSANNFGAYVSGGLATDFPHAGVLNTPGWLARYPSTATNRNRARSRWTWYHFMGFDIERSAPRTTDPDALSDTDNPTLKNSNCTVCHEVMDPVAGAYQNYGDEGFYKDQGGGVDSLPVLYKRDRDSEDPYQPGDVWYRDMREPGFDGAQLNNTESTLQDLTQLMVADHRFAVAAVKFWWPALMGEESARPPQEQADSDYAEQLALFQAQSGDIETLASAFEDGFESGPAFNLKDLLVEMLMSDWFRADAVAGSLVTEDAAFMSVGTGKLLTPEQLDRKTEAVTGYRWYENEYLGVKTSQLDRQYRLFYGGIDSDGVTQRATEMTALMSTVVEAQPLQMACILVAVDFAFPQSQRNLFVEVERDDHEGNADLAVRRQLQYLHERFLGESVGSNDPEIERVLDLFTETRAERIAEGFPRRLNGNDNESCPFQFFDTSELDLSDSQYALNTWVSVLIYYMTDFHYVYQ